MGNIDFAYADKKVHISCSSTQAVKCLFLLSKSNLNEIFEFQASNCFHLLHMLFVPCPVEFRRQAVMHFCCSFRHKEKSLMMKLN